MATQSNGQLPGMSSMGMTLPLTFQKKPYIPRSGRQLGEDSLGARFRLALHLKEMRDRREWKHDDIAKAIGKTRAYVSTIASMERAPQHLNIEETWQPIADLLEINLWWLLYNRGAREKETMDVSKAKSELYDKLVGASDEDARAVAQLIDAYFVGKKAREISNP